MERDFRHIDPAQARVILVEAGPRVLATFDESLSEYAASQLEQLGVEVWLRTRVTRVLEEGVHYQGPDGEDGFVGARTVLWAAGVQASPLGRMLGEPLDRSGRVSVEPDCSLKAHPEVFVIGDMALAVGMDGRPLPGVAPVAMQQGRHVAEQLVRAAHGQLREPFRYFDKGNMATIGRSAAVTEFWRLKLRGFVAWLAWLFVHIMYLVGFRNRVIVLLEWCWAYITFQRGARLIVGPSHPGRVLPEETWAAVASQKLIASARARDGDGQRAPAAPGSVKSSPSQPPT
jgi:NADH dehydrogenase